MKRERFDLFNNNICMYHYEGYLGEMVLYPSPDDEMPGTRRHYGVFRATNETERQVMGGEKRLIWPQKNIEEMVEKLTIAGCVENKPENIKETPSP